MPVKLGKKLTDGTELLLRHATSPGWIVDGRPSNQLFSLRPIDKGYLSVARASIAGGPTKALAHFNATYKSASISVWGVSVAEVHIEGLVAHEQPTKNLPAHAAIDLSAQSEDEQRGSAAKLTRHAVARGKLA